MTVDAITARDVLTAVSSVLLALAGLLSTLGVREWYRLRRQLHRHSGWLENHEAWGVSHGKAPYEGPPD